MKTILSTLIFFIIGTNLCLIAQEIQFSDVSNLPKARSAVGTAANDEYVFLANGFGPGEQYSSEIYQYDIANGTWTVLTDQSIPKRFGSMALVEDQLYVFNGQLSGGIWNPNLEIIDINTGDIVTVMNNPHPVHSAGVSTWDGKIYSFGGFFSEFLSDPYSSRIFELNPENNEWNEVGEMPISSNTEGEVVDGKLYIIGGYNGTVSDKIYIYDLDTKRWETPIDMNSGISGHSTGIIGKEIYVVGDYSNLNYLGVFDTESNTFTELTGNLQSRRHCGVVGVGGRLFAMGGNTESDIGTATDNVQVADITTSNIEQPEQELLLFPNPVYDQLSFNQVVEEVRIMNVLGHELKQSNYVQTMDLTDLSEGMYWIHLKEGSSYRVLKLVKK